MTETAQDLSTLPTLPLPDTRPGVVFWRTLRDNLTGALAWGAGFGALIVTAAVLYPLLNQSNTILTVLSGLGMLNFLSVGPDSEALTSFPGYVALQIMSFGPLILAVYIIPQAVRAIVQEEHQGTLDIVLSTPISRWRFLLEKMLAILASLVLILLLIWVSMMLSAHVLVKADLDVSHAVASAWHLLPISLVTLMTTLLLSAVLRDNRRTGSLTAMVLIASYFLRAMSTMTTHPVLEFLKPFSVFSYYRSLAAMIQGFQWDYDVVLLLAAAVLFVLTIIAFQRRDLGV